MENLNPISQDQKIYHCKNCKGVIQSWESFCDFNCLQEYMNKGRGDSCE